MLENFPFLFHKWKVGSDPDPNKKNPRTGIKKYSGSAKSTEPRGTADFTGTRSSEITYLENKYYNETIYSIIEMPQQRK